MAEDDVHDEVVDLLEGPLSLHEITRFNALYSAHKVYFGLLLLIRGHRFLEAHSLVEVAEGSGLQKISMQRPIVCEVVRCSEMDRLRGDSATCEPNVVPWQLTNHVRYWLVGRLCAFGASAQTRDARNQSPLFIAVRMNDAEMVQYLLDHTNASANGTTPCGLSMLAFAMMRGNYDLCQRLLLSGASPRWTNPNNGITMLHLAAYYHNMPEMMGLLFAVAPDLDVDVQTHTGLTPLMVASINERGPYAREYLRIRGARDDPVDGREVHEVDFRIPHLI
jgi:hypothetical protein